MKSEIYQQAKYYEVAFDFVNIKKQIDLYGQFISSYSRIPVLCVLDIACGPGLQLREFAKLGYKSIGLDLSPEMLKYLRAKSIEEKIKLKTIKANMVKFSLREKVDFAYILMGSIAYLKNNHEFLSHLNSVANSLKPGGLYLIENLAGIWANPKIWEPQAWDMESGNIKIHAEYQITLKNELTQTIEQTIKLEVNDSGKKLTLKDRDTYKLIMPQEFKIMVELQGDFEFLGFFERWSTKELEKASPNNIILLRKK